MFVCKYNIPVHCDFFYESRICEAYFYVCDLKFLHFHKEKVVFIFWFAKYTYFYRALCNDALPRLQMNKSDVGRKVTNS